MYHDFKGNLYL